ncbi:hypothetical protein C0J52_26445 [Blattella germanica]|nr:hypothetical protein C0J52_26445 [Blattella germanica]
MQTLRQGCQLTRLVHVIVGTGLPDALHSNVTEASFITSIVPFPDPSEETEMLRIRPDDKICLRPPLQNLVQSKLNLFYDGLHKSNALILELNSSGILILFISTSLRGKHFVQRERRFLMPHIYKRVLVSPWMPIIVSLPSSVPLLLCLLIVFPFHRYYLSLENVSQSSSTKAQQRLAEI